MLKVFVTMDAAFENILAYSTINLSGATVEAIQDDPVIDISKLYGYSLIRDVDNHEYHLVFDQEKYDRIHAEKIKEEAMKEAEDILEQLSTQAVLDSADDVSAYKMRYLYEEWKPDTNYEKDDRRRFGDNLYKCKHDHTSQEQHTPDLIPALWDILGDEDKGTKENPVIVPDEVSSMVYIKGKYYKEGDTLYLMNREGMKDGDEISLTFKPSQLVGQYFKIVEE